MSVKSRQNSTQIKQLRLPALRPGDAVGLVCPASRPFCPTVLKRCQKIVEDLGLKAILGKNVYEVDGFCAGSDRQRLADLNGFIADEKVKAIWCISGGYGSTRLIDNLDYKQFSRQPKIIIGSGDNSALLLALYAKTNISCFYGPNLDEIETEAEFDLLKKFLFSSSKEHKLEFEDSESFASSALSSSACPITLAGGKAEGRILGGNLTVYSSLLSTGYLPMPEENLPSIMFFDDSNERNDMLDRWYCQLALSGHFDFVEGFVFGSFENCGAKGSNNLLSLPEYFAPRLKERKIPSVFGLPLSNGLVLPLGAAASLDADKQILEFETNFS